MATTLPTVPTYYASPKLDYKVAQDIQVALDSGLGWLDRSYHIAKVGIDASQKSTYPQIYKNDGTKEHFDIRPDGSIGSYCFLEVDRPFITNKYEDTLSCFFSVIFWCNLDLIDPAKNYDYTSELIQEVIDVLSDKGASITETETRPENIFNNYSALQQELKQHLMRSYSGFKITFEVPGILSNACGNVIIDSCTQNVARVNALPTSVKACVVAAVSVCAVANVSNSDDSYLTTVASGGSLEIPNISLTDSTGVVSSYPAAKAVVCTPQIKSTFLNFIFGIGATADYTHTIVSGEEGVYTANTLTNVSSVLYYKNSVLATLPITLVVGNTLRVVPTITNTAIAASVKLTGTY